MRTFLVFAILAFSFSFNAFALNAEVKGFLALDLLRVSKVKNRSQSVETGIGVLDLKIYGNQDNIFARFKLDLDDSKLGEPYNIFEEATATYRFRDNMMITAGKGVVPFHRLHWGVIENTYIDGGSVIGTENSWRDVDQKIILSFRLGEFKSGWINHTTFWGESKAVSRDRDGALTYDSNDALTFTNAKTFKTDEERGFANKLEFFPNNALSLSVGAIYYKADIAPDQSYAFDTGAKYRTSEWELWTEYMYGVKTTNASDKYATREKAEHFLQFGAEKTVNQLINVLVDIEGIMVKDLRHSDRGPTGKLRFNDGKTYKTNNAKIESGVKFKISKAAFVTVGALFEKQWQKIDEVDSSKSPLHAYEFATKLSFWF
ncbi:MAG: hypothetical protein COW00_19945 [Bdellovibrio sp. CG12_big_fil_rev_8_21_14_0_65_39_13]|nr:MAG: hypothetical protein COW78_02120 [Bdellovibrio sp. CG22_combo_CG10-13_8_21_14_all_39_27]PIQ57647.1 MAG: hypothetical protein COW00_19945 [Bdellovibrio sp. CG12_big_fil_rev_8_21_14_0_65_39_13]PIR35811.1 MAG: hypothetical protein COV37_06325 [Bdellovibrio sp. CG11_big_fil_rev_8_21_14_0_20_39_38]